MFTIVLIAVLVVVLASLIVSALRRNDSNNYFNQNRQPFYAEPDALVEGGLLYSQRDWDGEESHTFTLTPAGEAGLRAWLREPSNDPGFLHLNYAGILTKFEPLKIADHRRDIHEARKAEYERIEQLLVNRPEWRYALAAARAGVRFERECLRFWSGVADEYADSAGEDKENSKPSEKTD